MLTDLPVICSDLQQVFCQKVLLWRQQHSATKSPRFYLADIKGYSWTLLTPFHVPDGSVVIVTKLGSIPDKSKTSPSYLTCLWARMNSYTMGVGNSLPGGSAAGA